MALPRTVGLALAAALLPVACGDPRGADDRPPNVLLVSFDTTRADHLSCYGYERDTSPTIDGLAREGILFERALSTSPKTAPSHMSILTGLLPEAHGVRNLESRGNVRLHDGARTLAEHLVDAGYRTAAFTGGGQMSEELGFERGFETYEVVGRVTETFTRGLEAVRGFGDEPFFLFLHTYEVHDPYTPPEEFGSRWTDPGYDGEILSTPRELRIASEDSWERQHDVFWEHVDDESESDRRHLIDLYDGSIRYADGVLGEFLETLEEMGELDRTLVVFLSDHGEEFGEHGGWLHQTLYEEVLHVPLVVRPPAGFLEDARGHRVTEPVPLIDVLPTVLELVGRPPAKRIHGTSLVAAMAGGEVGPRPLLGHWPRAKQFSLERDDWKLYWRGEDELELYSLDDDPAESNDLADDEPAVRDRLVGELETARTAARLFAGAGEARLEGLSEEKRAELRALGYLTADD